MTREDVLTGLAELLETDAPLKGSERLSDFAAWDSMAVLGFVARTDESYGVTLVPNDIRLCKTTGDLANLVVKDGPAGL